MRTTPEGKVKAKVKRIVAKFGDRVYTHWPVLSGMGAPTLDCIGSVGGHAFAVETKAAGEDLTPRQRITRRDMMAAGVTVFRIVGLEEWPLLEFEAWLRERANVPTDARTRYEQEARCISIK